MKKSVNHGEGNPEAAERFNHAETEFVTSKRGKKRISERPRVSPGEEVELEEAEQRARERARGTEAGGEE